MFTVQPTTEEALSTQANILKIRFHDYEKVFLWWYGSAPLPMWRSTEKTNASGTLVAAAKWRQRSSFEAQ